MKKFLVSLILILFEYINLNHAYVFGKDYTTINKNFIHKKSIIEFFSFICPYCYNLEKKYNINSNIKKNVSKKIKILKCHVNLLGGEFEKLLTKLWIISVIKKLEKKIFIPIFEGIQKTHTITNLSNLKKTFLKLTHINEKEYHLLMNSSIIKSYIYQQEKLQKLIKLTHVPTILINEKYIINNDIFINKSTKQAIEKYINLVKHLLNKNS
ncbi:MAG: DsbA family protein [Buchnera aphidicola (Chaetogeoica yunlongensis)]